ncbi:unnamed protein product, partial [marine sediment metagenome]
MNIEQDHLDYYKNEDEIVEAFGEFALGVKPDGGVIANGNDANVAKVISMLDARCSTRIQNQVSRIKVETFGLDENCNFYAKNISLNDGLYA